MAGSNFFAAKSATVDVALTDATNNAILVKATTGNIPSAVAGYAIGCVLINTTTGGTYTNTGTASSCTFTQLDSSVSEAKLDNIAETLGTTTTTPATYIKLIYDKTTTGVGLMNIGSIAVPQVLNTNPGATVAVDTVNILHSAGAGDCDDLLGRYTKVAVSGAGDSDLTLVADAPRAYILSGVASQAYASQPWISHAGTGAITAMSALSAKADVNTDAFTASTINAGHFHVEGAATVTGQFDGVMIEIYPDVTCLDAGLAIAVDAGAVVTSGIRITGSPLSEMTLSSGAKVFTGTAATRAAVRAQVGDTAPLGSMYIGVGAVATTKPYTYIKVINTPGDTDWERVVTQASD